MTTALTISATFACQRGYCPDGACISDDGDIAVCDEDGDDRPGCAETPYCDPTLEFDDFDALLKASGTFPDVCADMYALQVLSKMLDEALANYTDVDNGYDEKFGYYVKYIKDMVPVALEEFMDPTDGKGNKYFTCTWNENGYNWTVQQSPFDGYRLG